MVMAPSEPVAKPSTKFKLCLPSSTYMRDNWKSQKHTHTHTHTHIIHTLTKSSHLFKGIQWFLQFWSQHESTSKIIINHKVTIKGCRLQITCKTLMGGSRFAWVFNFLYVFAVFQYFQMPEKIYTFSPTFPFKHMNCTIFYVSTSSNIQRIWHVTLVYSFWVQIYENYWYFIKRRPFFIGI
jgi:hypothetical protein